MASVNKVIILGNLTRDPETRYMSNSEAVTNITVATSEVWKDKSGQKQEKSEFHRITFYRKLAEIAGEYLKKGKPVYVEGRLETRKYNDKNGIERYVTEIIATEMKMLGSRTSGAEQDTSGANHRTSGANHRTSGASQNNTGFDDMEEDIPF